MIHRDHLRRVHFPSLSCPFQGCKYHTSEKFHITRHQEAAHPGEVRNPIPRWNMDPKLLHQSEALKRRKLTMKDIKNISFEEEKPNGSPAGVSQESSLQSGCDGTGKNKEDPTGGDKEGYRCHTSKC